MTVQDQYAELEPQIRACRLCAEDFLATATRHAPRPIVWFRPGARILIVGQAPGLRVHESGIPFDDRSGDRLREWMGVSRDEFYDQDRVAVVPMAFCFPGYDSKRSDLPPQPRCAATWRERAMAFFPEVSLTIVIGGYAQGWHLGPEWRKAGVNAIALSLSWPFLTAVKKGMSHVLCSEDLLEICVRLFDRVGSSYQVVEDEE